MDRKVFWMVKGEGPAYEEHPTYESAKREAKRLADKRRGSIFYVVQAVSAFVKDDVREVHLTEPDNLSERPF